jgi:uncharacterized membrane protein
MNEWYYAREGKQSGPVSFEQLAELARNGGLNRTKDLVWTSTMKDWLPAGEVPELFTAPPPPLGGLPAGDPANPYSAPASTWSEPELAHLGEVLPEIPPGSEPIDIMACIKRGVSLTARNFPMILLVGLVYWGITMAAGVIFGLIDSALGWAPAPKPDIQPENLSFSYQQAGGPVAGILGQVLSIFLYLGATRIGLNIVSGKPFSVGMLFGGGDKLLRAIGATILYMAMVIVGLVLLIVPGIYLAMRFGQYQMAIVDKNMGILESFSYSSSITTNNRMNLLGLAVLSILIFVAGCAALLVGIFFAIPVAWLSWVVAYRWMQHGHRAALDSPGTVTPMLGR